MRKSGVGSRGGWDRGTGSALRWWHRWAAEGPLPPTSAAGRRWGGEANLAKEEARPALIRRRPHSEIGSTARRRGTPPPCVRYNVLVGG